MNRQRVRCIAVVAGFAAGCADLPPEPPPAPAVAPDVQTGASVALGDAGIRPMYTEVLAIDLPTVRRVALARNLDVQVAREQVEAARGRYEASVEAIFPIVAPAIAYQHVSGANLNANGTLVSAHFGALLPAITLQWIVNPGRVYYDVVASKRRMEASVHEQRAVALESLRRAMVEYYDLVLAQARVAAARQAVTEAEETLRLARARVQSGTGLPADETRALASLAGRQQDALLAVKDFYDASLALTTTLDLDPTVTLAPSQQDIEQVTLVRDDLAIDELMRMALTFRPDLESARVLLAAARADDRSVLWGALGPQLLATYSYGGLSSTIGGETAGPHARSAVTAGAAVTLDPKAFGESRAADAGVRAAALDIERRLATVREQVVAWQQAARTNAGLIPIAADQVRAAEESLRLARASLTSGDSLLLDVLHSEAELDRARVSHAAAVARYDQSQIELLAALGLLRAEDSAPPAGAGS